MGYQIQLASSDNSTQVQPAFPSFQFAISGEYSPKGADQQLPNPAGHFCFMFILLGSSAGTSPKSGRIQSSGISHHQLGRSSAALLLCFRFLPFAPTIAPKGPYKTSVQPSMRRFPGLTQNAPKGEFGPDTGAYQTTQKQLLPRILFQ